jgi:LPXTG-motif cell wall-anchored protein
MNTFNALAQTSDSPILYIIGALVIVALIVLIVAIVVMRRRKK